jgi:ferric-dicitrate binding protein FerR (iron transport regulator)
MMDEQPKVNGDESLAELLRLAGPRPRIAGDVTARVRSAVHEEWQQQLAARRRVRRGIIAGVAAAAAIAGVFIVRMDEPAPVVPAARPPVARVETIAGSATATPADAKVQLLPSGETVIARTTVETAPGSTASLRWAGATLRLDGGTRLRLDSSRTATLHRGAIYFSSDKAGGQVVIRTPFGAIHDVGTQFEVRLAGDHVRIRVREGSVDLRRSGGATNAVAGMELVATASSATTASIPRTGEQWAWVERAAPRIVLEGMTLDEVMRRVAREKGLELDWRTAVGTRRLHGNVPLNPDEALEAAAAAAGVAFRIEGEKLVVR